MMRFQEFSDQLGRKIRIWLNDLPDGIVIDRAKSSDSCLLDSGVERPIWEKIAIEVFVPIGASFQYGLLGGEWGSCRENKFNLVLPESDSSIVRPYSEAITGRLDSVINSAPTEYLTAIRSGVDRLNVCDRLQGKLRITCIAHGEIGSSPNVFERLAQAIIYTSSRSHKIENLYEILSLFITRKELLSRNL